MSNQLRIEKLQELIKQEVSKMLLYDIKDPRIGFVTVTEVEMTGDLREATIFEYVHCNLKIYPAQMKFPA